MAVKCAGGTGPGSGAGGAGGNRGGRAGGGKGGKLKKKECKKKLSEAQKKKLRDSTPSDSVTNMVNKRASKGGSLKCPTCGGPSPPGFSATTGTIYPRLSADHIVPVDTIMKKKGFACLSEKNQKKVLNNKSNFAGICPPCNSSRQETKWRDWNGRNPHGLTSAGRRFANQQQAASQQISNNLGSQISRLWR